MNGFIVTHNGMTVKFLKDEEEVKRYIQEVITKYNYLRPIKIIDELIKEENYQIIIYEYSTMYKEMFLIQES
jgi:hypothetical protein